MTTTLNLHDGPGASFEQPFEMLRACHARVERMLALLERLAHHLRSQGCDADARQAAHDVMRYFDLAGPAHHEDEERHLFPLLQADAAAAPLRALVQRLQADHRAMARQWQVVRADLDCVAQGTWPAATAGAIVAATLDPAAARWDAFANLYREHIVAEETQAYPATQLLLDAAAQTAMGREMAARRGAR